jgi:hypothetical protein
MGGSFSKYSLIIVIILTYNEPYVVLKHGVTFMASVGRREEISITSIPIIRVG